MIGAAIGPILGGALVQGFGYGALGVAAVVIAAIAVFLFSQGACAARRDCRPGKGGLIEKRVERGGDDRAGSAPAYTLVGLENASRALTTVCRSSPNTGVPSGSRTSMLTVSPKAM